MGLTLWSPEHPFVIRRGDEWGFASAEFIQPGDFLIDEQMNEEEVESIVHIDAPARTVAIHIPGTNTLLAEGVWVHNDMPATAQSSGSGSGSGSGYIAAQKHEGWICLPERYDDGGFTGGNMDRRAVRRLMKDIDAGKVDCVVVYKVDRLSRSLMDFAKMMETFDRHKVPFVSVTQQFNTMACCEPSR